MLIVMPLTIVETRNPALESTDSVQTIDAIQGLVRRQEISGQR